MDRIEQKLINDLNQVFTEEDGSGGVVVDYNNPYKMCCVYIQNISFQKIGEKTFLGFDLIVSKTGCNKEIGYLYNHFIYGQQKNLFEGYTMVGEETELTLNDSTQTVIRKISVKWSGKLDNNYKDRNDDKPIEKVKINELEVNK